MACLSQSWSFVYYALEIPVFKTEHKHSLHPLAFLVTPAGAIPSGGAAVDAPGGWDAAVSLDLSIGTLGTALSSKFSHVHLSALVLCSSSYEHYRLCCDLSKLLTPPSLSAGWIPL